MSDRLEADAFKKVLRGNISLFEFVDVCHSNAKQEMSVGDRRSASSASQFPPSEDEVGLFLAFVISRVLNIKETGRCETSFRAHYYNQ
uniref:Uncharacterized protein n=1 Tax=Steinernema glaseri TaxID=37863 RepID=A0A1I8A1H5_9BILA